MKFRLILSLLFIIATTFTALHEIEHVKHHNGSTCQICALDDHQVSGDIIIDFKDIEFYSFEQITSPILISYQEIKQTTNQSRAPPLNS